MRNSPLAARDIPGRPEVGKLQATTEALVFLIFWGEKREEEQEEQEEQEQKEVDF
jgi:hypothetical protein